MWRGLPALALLLLWSSPKARSKAVSASPSLRLLRRNLTEIHWIGDLHADDTCARQWIARTGMVDMESSPWRWTGGADSAIVFLGDYVDKGTRARAVLELVRALEEAFPEHVVAMMVGRIQPTHATHVRTACAAARAGPQSSRSRGT